jgi:hypothetical protein
MARNRELADSVPKLMPGRSSHDGSTVQIKGVCQRFFHELELTPLNSLPYWKQRLWQSR